MASSSRCNLFQSPTPNFFKVILPQTLTKQKLAVPINFVRNHEEALQTEEVCLKVASGAQWIVGLEKVNGKVWFGKGWNEFVTFYSIKSCYFLTFRYDGNFCFYVVIFDKSCLEIKYPMPIKREIEVFEDREILDSKKRSRKKHVDHKDVKFQSKKASTKKSSFGRICKRASQFESTATNPSFFVKMRSSYIHTDTGRSYLNIPIAFAKIHLKESTWIILQVSDGRIWKIWCGVRLIDENRKKVEMRDGWRGFVADNNLKVDDICVFELIQTTPQISFKVTINFSTMLFCWPYSPKP